MQLYKQSDDKLFSIKEKKFPLEKDLQKIVEKNLEEVFGLKFISTEFPLNNLRIDSLAFDEETKAFVIIEYKKGQSFSIIDQGYSYLSLMLNNKADFVLEYNEKCNKNIKKDNIDWSQSRIIFIASSFTKYQKEATSFKDLPIQTWEVKKYENGLVSFNEIKSPDKNESIKTITKNPDIKKVSKEIKTYTIEDHIKPHWNESRELFDTFSQKVLEIDSKFEIRPVKSYIGFSIDNRNVIDVHVRKNKLFLELLRVRPEDLKDPEKKVSYMKNSFKFYNKHVSFLDVNNNEESIDYAMFLIKQVYKKFFMV